MSGVIFDHSALLWLGGGNVFLSRIVAGAAREGGRVYVPALCLAAAEAQRSGLAAHIGALPAMDVIELGFVGAATVGRLIDAGADWRYAHALYSAAPDPEFPDGRPVVTDTPSAYGRQYGVRVISILGD